MRSTLNHLSANRRTALTILVAALGYFVDVFDIQLFGIVRVKSLQSLGLTPDQVTLTGAHLLNWQMAGMLLGGLVWGMLGDKKGRIQVLFGTILLYSLGNIANAFVTGIPGYAAARFVSGFGLAGEIGAGITLASELIPRQARGYATVLVAVSGTMGPVAGTFFANAMDWRWAYALGGLMGLLLLLLRIGVRESGLFDAMKHHLKASRGRFQMFFMNKVRLMHYIGCIFLGLPIWFTLGTIVIFAPEIGAALGTDEPLKASSAVISYFTGQTFGGILCGLLSQFLGNRKKVTAFYVLGAGSATIAILTAKGISANGFYALLVLDSMFCGYWGLFLTITAESFGTNMRTMAVSTVSNFVRASVIIDTLLIAALKQEYGLIDAVGIVGSINFLLGIIAIWRLPETFACDLDFMER